MGGFYGQGTGPIILDDVNCFGNESSLAACGHRDWYINNCRHNEDAGVICGGTYTSYDYHKLMINLRLNRNKFS